MKKNTIKILSVAITVVIIVAVVLVLSQKPKGLGVSFTTTSNQFNSMGKNIEMVAYKDGALNSTTSTVPTYVLPFSQAGYKFGSLQVSDLANATFTIQATNDTPASSTAGVATWTDITTDVVGTATVSANGFVFLDTEIIANQLRIVFTTSTDAATGTIRSTFSN